MGKRPGDIEQEIAQRRQAISRKVDDMTARGADDVREVGDRIQGMFDSSPIKSSAESQPLLTIAGAVAVGVVLGMASESVSLPSLKGGGNGSYDSRHDSSASSSGLFAGVLAGLETAAIEEGRQLIHEWMSPTRNGTNTNGNNRDGSAQN